MKKLIVFLCAFMLIFSCSKPKTRCQYNDVSRNGIDSVLIYEFTPKEGVIDTTKKNLIGLEIFDSIGRIIYSKYTTDSILSSIVIYSKSYYFPCSYDSLSYKFKYNGYRVTDIRLYNGKGDNVGNIECSNKGNMKIFTYKNIGGKIFGQTRQLSGNGNLITRTLEYEYNLDYPNGTLLSIDIDTIIGNKEYWKTKRWLNYPNRKVLIDDDVIIFTIIKQKHKTINKYAKGERLEVTYDNMNREIDRHYFNREYSGETKYKYLGNTNLLLEKAEYNYLGDVTKIVRYVYKYRK